MPAKPTAEQGSCGWSVIARADLDGSRLPGRRWAEALDCDGAVEEVGAASPNPDTPAVLVRDDSPAASAPAGTDHRPVVPHPCLHRTQSGGTGEHPLVRTATAPTATI